MKGFLNWLENKFVPRVNKLMANAWVKGVSSSMFKVLPFILTGSLIFVYNVIRSYVPSLPDASPVMNYSFGLLGLFVSFVVAFQLMETLNLPNYRIVAGLTSVGTMIMMTLPQNTDLGTVYATYLFGATGFLMGMVIAIFVSVIFNIVGSFHLLEDSVNVPMFLVEWINSIIPIFLTLTLASVLVFGLNFDFNATLTSLFNPILTVGDSFFGLILIILIPTFFYSLGISSWFFYSVQLTIFIAAMQMNIDQVAAGGVATHIVTQEVVYSLGLITLGGTGATLALNLLMFKAKSKKLRTLAKVSIVPSLFNINEPINFGAPIVFNPYLMVPMWINAITGPALAYTIMKLGLLAIPYDFMAIAQVPAPFSAFLVTQDVRAFLWYFVFLGMFLATWYPFYKAYDKKLAQEEAK